METRNDARSAPMTPGSDAPPPTQPEKASLLEDYIDILYAPASVFARRALSGFGLHLLIISLLTAVLMFANRGVFMQIFDAQYTVRMAEAMRENPQLTPEMVENMRGMQRTIGSIVNYIITPIMLLIFGLILWVLARVAGAKLSVKQSTLVATLASVPRVLGLVAMAIQIAFMDTSNVTHMGQLSVGPARFMEPQSGAFYGLMTGLDLFAIWNAVLVGVGVAVIGKVSAGRATIAAALYFLLSTAPLLLQ